MGRPKSSLPPNAVSNTCGLRCPLHRMFSARRANRRRPFRAQPCLRTSVSCGQSSAATKYRRASRVHFWPANRQRTGQRTEKGGIRRRGRPKGVKDSIPRKRRTHQEIILTAPTARSRPCTSVKLAARWASLPREVLARIFSFVLCDGVLSGVCMSWRDAIRSKREAPSTSIAALEMRID